MQTTTTTKATTNNVFFVILNQIFVQWYYGSYNLGDRKKRNEIIENEEKKIKETKLIRTTDISNERLHNECITQLAKIVVIRNWK